MQLDLAWQTLREAEQIAPDHPELAKIEVTLLLHQENWQQASARCHFWALRFRRLYGEAMQPTIDLLEQIANNPQQALAQPAPLPDAALHTLLQLAQHTPPPESAYRLQTDHIGSAKLEPSAQLQEALDEWYQKYTFLPQQTALKGVPYALAWQMAEQWLPALQQNPILWQSFEVLDDLIRMIADGHPHSAKSATQPLVERGCDLFTRLQAPLHARGCRLSWQIVENRPAMHLAILHLDNLIDQGQATATIAWLEMILQTFDAQDEQRWREVLMPFYLEQARYDDALALAIRYPNDTINMRYDHALALFMQSGQGDQQNAANAQLANAISLYPMIAMALLARRGLYQSGAATRRKTDADHQSDLTIAYCDTHHGLWPKQALDWLETQYPQEHAP
jgi:Transcriptional repressor TCF25